MSIEQYILSVLDSDLKFIYQFQTLGWCSGIYQCEIIIMMFIACHAVCAVSTDSMAIYQQQTIV